MRWINKNRLRKHSLKTNLRRNIRRRTAPRWLRRWASIGGILTCFALSLGGPTWLWQSGWLQDFAKSCMKSAVIALGNTGLRVEEILLKGRVHESTTNITRTLNIKQGDPILAVDLKTARERLEKLSWIRAASVKRVFPDTIRVQIAERKPLAVWQQEQRRVLIDAEGTEILERHPDRFPHLLVIAGHQAPKHAISLLNMLAKEPGLRRRVNGARFVGKRRWNIEMDNGIFIRLPEKNTLTAWRRFAYLERQHRLLEQNLTSIDLRIPNQLIVRHPRRKPLQDKFFDQKRKGTNT